jgi:hypothetical protein
MVGFGDVCSLLMHIPTYYNPGTIWHCGGIDGKPGERLHFDLTPWRWVHRETGGGLMHAKTHA